MTTVGEFLSRTKPLIKQAEGDIDPKKAVRTLDDNPDITDAALDVASKEYRGPLTGIMYWNGPQQLYEFAHNAQPKRLYLGNEAPQDRSRYVYLANRLFGSEGIDNPYIEYFSNVPEDYHDQDFMYDVHEILKNNPKVGPVIMSKIMGGDPLFADLIANEARNGSKMDPEGARKAMRGAQYLYKQLNTLGNSFLGPEIQGNALAKQFANNFDDKLRQFQSGKFGRTMQRVSPYLVRHWEENARAANFGQYTDAYNQKIFQPVIADNRLKHNFYGKLQDPGVRNAVRYAAPWLSYGVPLAATASAFGNNDLWGPVGMGLVASGAYGYTSGKGYVPQIGLLDNLTTLANKPLVWAGNKLMQGYEGLPLKEVFLDPVKAPNNTNQSQPTYTQPQQNTTPQQPNTNYTNNNNHQLNNNPYQFNTTMYRPYV